MGAPPGHRITTSSAEETPTPAPEKTTGYYEMKEFRRQKKVQHAKLYVSTKITRLFLINFFREDRFLMKYIKKRRDFFILFVTFPQKYINFSLKIINFPQFSGNKVVSCHNIVFV